MKKLILIFIVTFCCCEASWLSGYEYRIKLEISNTNIDATLTWFPIIVSLTSSQGEEVFVEFDADADFDRIQFTTADGTTLMYADCELFDDSEQKAIYHVSKTGWTISSSSITDIYLYYDNTASNNTTYVSMTGGTGAQSVWDNDYIAVFHMQDATTSTIYDATSNNKDGTKDSANNPSQTTSGKIGNAQTFTSDKITVPQVFTTNSTNLTVEVVVKRTAAARYIIYQDTPASAMFLQITSPDRYPEFYGGDGEHVLISTALSLNTWHYIVGRFDGSNIKIFQNYSTTATTAAVGTTWSANSLYIGDNGAGARYWIGSIDEIRLSETDRSDAWIKATYYGINDNLLTYNSEELRPITTTNNSIFFGINF